MTQGVESSEAPSEEPFVERVMTAVAWISVAVIVVCAALVLTFDHGRDQSIYALVAREMLHGKMPYRDAFDFKPPGIFIVYALARAIFGPAQVGIRILEVLSMLGTVWGLVRLSERFFGRRSVGLLAGALASQMHAQLDFWHTAQPETFGGTMTIWALVLCLRGLDADSKRMSFIFWGAAGALFGAAGLMKPPLAGAGAVIALLAAGREIVRARSLHVSPEATKSWVPIAGMAIGGITPIVLTLAWFSAKGALGDLRQVLFVFTPEYTKISWKDQNVLPMAYYGVKEWLMGYSSTMLMGLVCLLAFRPTRSERTGVVALLACIAVHIAGIVAQAKFFPYHWAATFPLTAMLAALGFEKALLFAARRGQLSVGVLAAVVLVLAPAKWNAPNFDDWSFPRRSYQRVELLIRPPPTPFEWDQLASIADVNAAQNRAVAAYLAQNTKPGDPIYVWGFECAIYDMADRPLSSRFIYNVPQRAVWSQGPMQEALMADLEKTPPAAIVVEMRDIFPMVTGSTDDSQMSLYKFPALRAMVEDHYRMTVRIGDFDVYMRRTEEPVEVGVNSQ